MRGTVHVHTQRSEDTVESVLVPPFRGFWDRTQVFGLTQQTHDLLNTLLMQELPRDLALSVYQELDRL